MSLRRVELKSIAKRDFRRQIESLMNEGWEAKRTGKNHLRLSHPLAHKDVITSGTPSDFRATENLKSQCRRAMLPLSGDIRPEQAPAGMQMPPAVETARARRKPRWDDADRSNRMGGVGFSPEMQASPAQSYPLRMPKPDLSDVGSTVHKAILADAEARKVDHAKKSVVKPKVNAPKINATIKETEGMTIQATSPILSVAQAAHAPHQVKEPVASGTAQSILHLISADLLSVAMRILSGQLRAIPITSDMVGKTMVIGAEGWLIDGGLPDGSRAFEPIKPDPVKAAPLKIGPTKAGGAHTSSDMSMPGRSYASPPSAFSNDDPVMKSLLEAMNTFEGSWLSILEIIKLVPNEGV
jgi:hypothetical protein